MCMGAERPKFIRAEGGRCVLVVIGVTRGGIKTRGGDHLMSGAYPHFKPYMSLRMLYRVPVMDDALHGFDHILEALGPASPSLKNSPAMVLPRYLAWNTSLCLSVKSPSLLP